MPEQRTVTNRTANSCAVVPNTAFMRELKRDQPAIWNLVNDIRGLCSSVLRSESSMHRFRNSLAQLRDKIAFYFALENAYGFFEGAAFPIGPITEESARLRTQHEELYRLISTIADRAEDLTGEEDKAPLVQLTQKFKVFETLFIDHEAAEARLMKRFEEELTQNVATLIR